VVDPSLAISDRGIWAVKWSFVGLIVTAIAQAVVVIMSGSVALLADTIHNIGDAATAVPLWIAFRLSQSQPTRRFTYGFGRGEDLAGLVVLLIILVSAIVTGYESIDRLLHPQPVTQLTAVMVASLIGFFGNEAVARFRIRVGTEMGSAALIADGHHARMDSLTSLAVLLGAIAVALGLPIADPLVGLVITAAIARIVWQSAQAILTRLLDGVEPEVMVQIETAIAHALAHEPAATLHHTRARWMGHHLHIELNLAMADSLTLKDSEAIAAHLRHHIEQDLPYGVTVKTLLTPQDPPNAPTIAHTTVQAPTH
jgi:cation diffusion facilitator family transporter